MKPKILLLQERIVDYRVPIYNLIAEKVDLTVGFTVEQKNSLDLYFKTIRLEYFKIKGLWFIKNIKKICSNYDVVIFLADLHYVSYCMLPFLSRQYKAIPWTIGIRASYTNKYNINRDLDYIDKIYGRILKKSDALIFYMKESIGFWGNRIDKSKVFIAHNTVKVIDVQRKIEKKNKILFVGTLYKEKKIFDLIDAYIQAKNGIQGDRFYTLDIVGNGIEYDAIKRKIKENKLEDFIVLHGAIYNEELLADFFSESILCISPNQAGLSVLKSMGYGVPYVTRFDAITGGERLNIINQVNGILYERSSELTDIIVDSFLDQDKYIQMGARAKQYYLENATPEIMANGVLEAINFSLK